MVSMRKGIPLTRTQKNPITSAATAESETPASIPHQPEIPA